MAQSPGNVNLISIVFQMALLSPPSFLPRIAVGINSRRNPERRCGSHIKACSELAVALSGVEGKAEWVRNYKKGFRTVSFVKGLYQVRGL